MVKHCNKSVHTRLCSALKGVHRVHMGFPELIDTSAELKRKCTVMLLFQRYSLFRSSHNRYAYYYYCQL